MAACGATLKMAAGGAPAVAGGARAVTLGRCEHGQVQEVAAAAGVGPAVAAGEEEEAEEEGARARPGFGDSRDTAAPPLRSLAPRGRSPSRRGGRRARRGHGRGAQRAALVHQQG